MAKESKKKTLKKLPINPPEIPNNDTPNLNLIVKELTILQRDYATKVPKAVILKKNEKKKNPILLKVTTLEQQLMD